MPPKLDEQMSEVESVVSRNIIYDSDVEAQHFGRIGAPEIELVSDSEHLEVQPEDPPEQHPLSGKPNRQQHAEGTPDEWPEQSLVNFAFWLAFSEKAASMLGMLSFIWATTILLGGFASNIRPLDFWFVTITLVLQGLRIFSLSHQLHWQRHGRLVLPVRCPRFPNSSRTIIAALYSLQLVAAIACAVLSLLALIKQQYSSESGTKNRDSAIIIFYTLVLASATVSILQKAYFEYNYSKLLDKVYTNCGFNKSPDAHEDEPIEQFFYHVYDKCINGHTLEATQTLTDLVQYAEELLMRNDPRQQQTAAWILCKFMTLGTTGIDENDREGRTRKNRRDHALHKVGSNGLAVERLVEILGWVRAEKKLRWSAAEIVATLVGEKPRTFRVAAIPGSLDCISSLLRTPCGGLPSSSDEIVQSVLGLEILLGLVTNESNCHEVIRATALLAQILTFTAADKNLLVNAATTTAAGGDGTQVADDNPIPEPDTPMDKNKPSRASQFDAVKLALKVLRKLACADGGALCQNPRTLTNLESLLHHRLLCRYVIPILMQLGKDDKAKDKIWTSPTIITELSRRFLSHQDIDAGQTLYFLTLMKNNDNNEFLFTSDIVEKLFANLMNHNHNETANAALIICSANILANLYRFNAELPASYEDGTFSTLTDRINIVWDVLRDGHTKVNVLQAFLGLAGELLKIFKKKHLARLTKEHRERLMRCRAAIDDESWKERVFEILEANWPQPPDHVPNLRWYTIKMAIRLMKTEDGDEWRQMTAEKKSFYTKLMEVQVTASNKEDCYLFNEEAFRDREHGSLHYLVKKAQNLCGGQQGEATVRSSSGSK